MSTEAISLERPPGSKPAESFALLHCLYDITHANPARLVYVEQVTGALRLDEAVAESAIQALVNEELVRLRLQCILSITQAGIDEVKSTFASLPPPLSAEPAGGSTLPPEPAPQASVGRSLLGVDAFAEEFSEPPFTPPQPALAPQERDDLELKLICEAIGLDPNELDGRPSPPLSLPDLPLNLSATVPVSAAPPFVAPPAVAPIPEAGSIAKTLTALMLQVPKLGLDHDNLAEAEAEIATSTAQLLSPRPKRPIIAISLAALLSILDVADPAAIPIDLQISLTEIRLFLAQLQS